MCYHPWVGLLIDPQGEFRPCCKYLNSMGTNIEEYQSSLELEQLKADFNSNIKNVGCQRCWDDENAGLPSKRQIDQKYIFNEGIPNLDSLKVLTFSFGSSCNLACRTCSSSASSAWIQQERILKQHIPNIQIYDHKKFYKDSQLIDQIKSMSLDVIHFEFIGGETFLAGIEEHLKFLDFILTLDHKNISLRYITNGTIFPSFEFWDRWKHFRNVDINLSIDGIGNRFEYIRWPGKWETLLHIVKQFNDKSKELSNIKLSVSHTVSVFNVYYLPEFVIWCLQTGLNMPYFGLVSSPNYYDIRSLPIEVKNKITEKLLRYNKFNNVLQYMNSLDLSINFNETIKYIRLLDQQRSQSFNETFLELNQLFKELKCQI